jgi:hypothetical protein
VPATEFIKEAPVILGKRRMELWIVRPPSQSMESYVITPKTQDEAEQLQRFLAEAHLNAKILTDEEKEDLGMMILMSEVDTSDIVSEDEIRKVLSNS